LKKKIFKLNLKSLPGTFYDLISDISATSSCQPPNYQKKEHSRNEVKTEKSTTLSALILLLIFLFGEDRQASWRRKALASN